MYSIQALWSAAELRRAGGVHYREQSAATRPWSNSEQHFKLTELPGTQLPHLDYCALARAQGVAALRVDAARTRCGARERAFAAAPHPMLVEVRVVPP